MGLDLVCWQRWVCCGGSRDLVFGFGGFFFFFFFKGFLFWVWSKIGLKSDVYLCCCLWVHVNLCSCFVLGFMGVSGLTCLTIYVVLGKWE